METRTREWFYSRRNTKSQQQKMTDGERVVDKNRQPIAPRIHHTSELSDTLPLLAESRRENGKREKSDTKRSTGGLPEPTFLHPLGETKERILVGRASGEGVNRDMGWRVRDSARQCSELILTIDNERQT